MTASTKVHPAAFVPVVGPAYVGAERGDLVGRPGAGVGRGLLGSLIGGYGGMGVGVLPGLMLSNPELAGKGGLAAGIVGAGLGAHYATKGMVPQEKQAFLGEALVGPLNIAVTKSVMRDAAEAAATPEGAKAFQQLKGLAQQKLPHVKTVDTLGGPGPGFDMTNKNVLMPMEDPYSYAHELGHAEIDNSRLGRLLQNPVTGVVGMGVPGAALGGGAASGYYDEAHGEDHKLRDAAIGAGIHAPQLGYEGLASYKGRKLLQEIGHKDLGKFDRQMGKAYGTYAMLPAVSAINYNAGRALGKMWARSDRKSKEKTKSSAAAEYPEFSPFTTPAATAASPVAADYHRAMLNRDRTLGGLGGAAAGALLGHHLGGLPGTAVGGLLGAAGGTLAGHFSGTERYHGDELARGRRVSEIERAQEHRKELSALAQAQRKELVDMRKNSSFDGVMLSAMTEELAAIHQEKVAINLAPVTGFMGNVGSKVLGGASTLADKAGPGISKAVSSGLTRASGMVGGAENLSKIVGGGTLAAGALGAGYLGKKMLSGPKQPTTTINVRR